jgi:tRNA-dihydrouridine synthase B
MIGRAALGKPWIFEQISSFLNTGKLKLEPNIFLKQRIIESHLKNIHRFYGETKGVWFARKHAAGYLKDLPNSREFLKVFNRQVERCAQLDELKLYFENQESDEAIAA